jgi:hypothetical protein
MDKSEYYTFIVKKVIYDYLKNEHSFKKKGNIFYKKYNDYSLVIYLYKNKKTFNNNSIEFTFEYGVYFPFFNDWLSSKYESKERITIERCLLLGVDDSLGYKNFYTINQKNEELEKAILNHLSNTIIPYLINFKDSSQAISSLKLSLGYIENIIAYILQIKTEGKSKELEYGFKGYYSKLNKFWKEKLDPVIDEMKYNFLLD